MKLEAPLLNLIKRCESICVPGCCGVGAYDFSPIHIASFLIMYRGSADDKEVRELKTQLEALSANYGESGASARGIGIEEMNENFTAAKLDRMVTEITENLNFALETNRIRKIRVKHTLSSVLGVSR